MADLGNSGVDIGDLDIRDRNVLDCTFASAPTDWYVAAGNWGTTNRWVCSPQWSWYGGRSDMAPTGLWSKVSYGGDTTVDMYSAFGMMLDQPRSYKNPCDFNITMCGDGLDLSSGYQFMVGAWQNSRSAIMKNGKILAQSSDPKHLLPVLEDLFPDMYSFHRKWWNVRARKTGNLLQLYYDERLVCEARDPDPLPEGHVALWGYDDRIILARVRIYFDNIAEGATVPYEKVAFRPETQVSDLPAPSFNAPNVVASGFEDSVGWFKPHQDGMAKLTLAAPGAQNSTHCLKIVNGGPGGNFGLDVIPSPVSISAMPMLEFDYKITPDVKVDLYASVGDRRYEVIFTGPPEGAATAQVCGQIPDVKTDGQWHHARFDLGAALRQAAHNWDFRQWLRGLRVVVRQSQRGQLPHGRLRRQSRRRRLVSRQPRPLHPGHEDDHRRPQPSAQQDLQGRQLGPRPEPGHPGLSRSRYGARSEGDHRDQVRLVVCPRRVPARRRLVAGDVSHPGTRQPRCSRRRPRLSGQRLDRRR